MRLVGFALDEGESEVHRERVKLVRDRKASLAMLLLTDRRLAVVVNPEPGALERSFGLLGALLAHALERKKARVAVQILRERFASVERGEEKLLIFRDDGEGYDHTSFAITSKTPFEVWQERLQRWRVA